MNIKFGKLNVQMDLSSLSLEELNSVDVQLREARKRVSDSINSIRYVSDIKDLNKWFDFSGGNFNRTELYRTMLNLIEMTLKNENHCPNSFFAKKIADFQWLHSRVLGVDLSLVEAGDIVGSFIK